MTVYDYRFLGKTLVQVQDLGVSGEKIIDEDLYKEDVLKESVIALREFIDSGILNPESQIGNATINFLENEYRRLKQLDNRIENAKEKEK